MAIWPIAFYLSPPSAGLMLANFTHISVSFDNHGMLESDGCSDVHSCRIYRGPSPHSQERANLIRSKERCGEEEDENEE